MTGKRARGGGAPVERRRALGVHVVCRSWTHVENLTDTAFETSWWKIREEHLRPGVTFALHEARRLPSYLQGTIEQVVATNRGNVGRG